MIAGGILLCGVLLALRYPADREEKLVAEQPLVAERNVPPSTPAMSQAETFVAPRSEAGERFEPIREFVNRDISSEWSSTSMSETGIAASGSEVPMTDETPGLDRDHYANISVNPLSPLEQEITPQPVYKPFQVANPVTMPESNPAFFAERPSPPNLTGFPDDGETLPVISPSAEMLPIIITNRAVPVTPSPVLPTATSPITATLARPVVPVSSSQELRHPPIVTPVVANVRELRNEVISAPAKTTILPR